LSVKFSLVRDVGVAGGDPLLVSEVKPRRVAALADLFAKNCPLNFLWFVMLVWLAVILL
jgi:hypothetical protein